MDIIDTVSAVTLEKGDTIRWWDQETQEVIGLGEIHDIQENDDFIVVVSEDGDEMWFEPFEPVDIYGYEDSEDE